jgi:hypothetical protein
MLTFKEKITKNYINARGWKSNQKYLIIESDDWGAIRMPSLEVYQKLIENGIPVDKFSFDKHDSLESEDDLRALFDTLEKFKDNTGSHAVLTAYHVVANPNFEKIEATVRKEYHYESILETYNRFSHTKKVPEIIKEGIKKGIYIPQFHGREHVHVKRWMEAINSNSEKEKLAFQHKAIISTISNTCKSSYEKNYFAGQDYSDESEFDEIEKINLDGLNSFENIFGFKSLSFTPQGSFWGDHILKTLVSKGVILIGGRQFHPVQGGKHKFINNKVWGEKNNLGQIHWRRNCLFEPARNQNFPWVDKCMDEIEIAFRWGKPAVISAHRENFIGSIFEENRIKSLEKLELLLTSVLSKWPDVKFISTHQLAEIMDSSINKY